MTKQDTLKLLNILIDAGWHEACFEGAASDALDDLDKEIDEVSLVSDALVVTFEDGTSQIWDLKLSKRTTNKEKK